VNNEWLILYSKKTRNQALQLPYFWSHHLPMKVPVGENAEYVNLGDWIILHMEVLMGQFRNQKY
jgi:UDP-2,3-diacylglucosamine hydrolase